jgi:hypothetical protein
MVAWGLFTTCLVTTKTVGTLMGLRFLIGSAEAFVHGTLIYLSFWYRYSELATRGALFEGCAALGGAFNGMYVLGKFALSETDAFTDSVVLALAITSSSTSTE